MYVDPECQSAGFHRGPTSSHTHDECAAEKAGAMTQWVIYDDKGVIEQDCEDMIRHDYETITDFVGDLVMAEIKAVRR